MGSPEDVMPKAGVLAGRAPWLFPFAAVLIVVLIAGVVTLVFQQEKSRYKERANSAAQNIVRLLDQQISDVFSKIDLTLQATAYFYDRQLRSGGINAADLSTYLTYQASLLPELDGMRITDREGIVRYGPDLPTDRLVDLSDREMFIRAREGKDDGLIITGPVFGRIVKKWVITVARRLNAPDGSFAGIVYATFDTRNFERNLSQASLGALGAATIRTTDMALVHRFPTTKNAIGSKEVSPQLRDIIRKFPNGGAYTAVTTLDGIERSNAFRKVEKAPFYVIVGLATQDYLDGWRTNLWLVSLLATMAATITVLASFFIYRAQQALRIDIANRIRISEELENMNARLEDMVADRTERLTQANRELEQIARQDALTNLGNRLFADERLREEFIRYRTAEIPFSALLLDIDFFKSVNDSFGHETGDGVLRQIAAIIAGAVRASDFVARFGGEEFLVILPGTRLEQAAGVAEKIRAAVAAQSFADVGRVTISVGVATVESEQRNKEDIVRLADQALYEAKSQGRNRVCLWHSECAAVC